LNSLQEKIKYKRIEEQFSSKIVTKKIERFKEKMIGEVCVDLPNAFWHRKKHVVKPPYIKDFSERNISTRA
jgi:hypothetical protein